MRKFTFLALALLMMAVGAQAYNTVNISNYKDGDSYTLQDGDILTGSTTKAVKIIIASGASVTLDNVTIDVDRALTGYSNAGLSPSGSCSIYLKGTNKITSVGNNEPAIFLPSSSTVHIYEKTSGASLTAKGVIFGTGIGGAMNTKDVGHLRVHGGTIKAIGGENAAGIGSAKGGKCGDIIIDGGTITAEGGESAAGIGSGLNGTCGTITINGGTINAKGGAYAAGIGSGEANGGSSSCGTITISGGSVTAKGGMVAPGIGSGGGASCGNITISKNVTMVKATKGDTSPCSIGKGADASAGTVKVADKTISGGVTESPFIYPVPTPTGLKVTDPSASTAIVSWTAASGVLKYKLYYMEVLGAGYYEKTVTKTSYILTDLKSNTEYYVWIKAYCSGDLTSAETSKVRFTTLHGQGIDEVLSDQVQSTKVIRNGQVVVVKGDKVFNLLGQEIQ